MKRRAQEPRALRSFPDPSLQAPPRRQDPPWAPPPHLRICWAVGPSRSHPHEPGSGPDPATTVTAAVAGVKAEGSGARAGTRGQAVAPWPSRTQPRFLPGRAQGSSQEPLPGLHTCLGVTRETARPSAPSSGALVPSPKPEQPMGFSEFAFLRMGGRVFFSSSANERMDGVLSDLW